MDLTFATQPAAWVAVVAALVAGLFAGVSWGRRLERDIRARVRAGTSSAATEAASSSAADPAASAPRASASSPPSAAASPAPQQAAPAVAPTPASRAPAPAEAQGLRLDANGDLILPATVGRYHVDAVLGRGAMGCVYRGRDAKFGRDVALKTLLSPAAAGGSLSGDSDREDARQRFFREAETGGRLKHPGIVTIYDAGEQRGLAYIAMELLHGTDLSHQCRLGQLLPPVQVVKLMSLVADALGHAHDRKVVHRDIKPSNIVWDPATGAVKITDFGVARLIDTEATSAGLAIGTPAYMAPEQVRGESVDGKSDIYALGATLFQMLTGRLPFVADQMSALLYRVVHEPAPDPRTLRPELPEAVSGILMKAMAKRAEDRHPDARTLARELAAAAESFADRRDDGAGDFTRTVVAPAPRPG